MQRKGQKDSFNRMRLLILSQTDSADNVLCVKTGTFILPYCVRQGYLHCNRTENRAHSCYLKLPPEVYAFGDAKSSPVSSTSTIGKTAKRMMFLEHLISIHCRSSYIIVP